MKIKKGTLEIIETFHDFQLWAKDNDGNDIFIACLGDGVDNDFENYDPNDDRELAEAYQIDYFD